MHTTGRLGILAALVSSLALGTALAQSTQNTQNQPKQSQSQNDQATGVSNPPPDSTIQATEIQPPPQPATSAPAKPSPAIPAAQSTSSAPAAKSAPAAQPQSNDNDDGIVTSVPPASSSTSEDSSDSQNPDYGIVLTPPPATPVLKPGQFNPNNDIVNYVPVDPNALAAGTNITVQLSQDLSTADTQRGAAFRATVSQNVYNGSTLVIPAGAEMRGRVVFVSQGHHIGPHATIRLRPDVIILPDGTAYHLDADVIASQAPGTRVNNEGGIEASHHYKKDAVEYGSGAGVGAIAGGEIAGPVGAGVGSVVGAGLVTTHMLVQPPQGANLPRGSVLIFSLNEAMPLVPTKN